MNTPTNFDRKAWTRLYEMRLGNGATVVEACRFANEQLDYPTGTELQNAPECRQFVDSGAARREPGEDFAYAVESEDEWL